MRNLATVQKVSTLREHLTHKGNLKNTRYGWLRLTPAYSVHLVSELLDSHDEEKPVVLDPFCGTGTTALVCAERGIESNTTDINPFLIWLATAKAGLYSATDIEDFEYSADKIAEKFAAQTNGEWKPELFQIEKWWDEPTLEGLSNVMTAIKKAEENSSINAVNLLKLAFCRVMIERANVSFAHQSMSFKKNVNPSLFPTNAVVNSWEQAVSSISNAARSEILKTPSVYLCDARNLTSKLETNRYSCVITSPPYPNRMSYIRELRPYMYWLKYLETAQDASELDWQAIGGTWGSATSKAGKWMPENDVKIPFDDFQSIIKQIAEKSVVLSRYVHKYFYDMGKHSKELFEVVKPGGKIHYIVGNSKFYDVMLPVELIFAALFESAGFIDCTVRTIRKRTSKKELFEFVVSATKP
ncbi:MAG: DNA methyltransferase [Pyrinomonadaceae bacterium]